MKDFGVTAICCTPSYFLHLIDRAARDGRRPSRTAAARRASSAPSPGPNPCGGASRALTGIKASTSTGCPRSSGPAWPSSAPRQNGLHIFEDHFYPEIIDPETGEPLPDGAGRRTGADHAQQAGHADDPLPHARHHVVDSGNRAAAGARCGACSRIGRRSDDMLIIRGVNVFPSQVEAALLEVEGTLPHYQIVLTRDARPRPDGSAGGGDAATSSATGSARWKN